MLTSPDLQALLLTNTQEEGRRGKRLGGGHLKVFHDFEMSNLI